MSSDRRCLNSRSEVIFVLFAPQTESSTFKMLMNVRIALGLLARRSACIFSSGVPCTGVGRAFLGLTLPMQRALHSRQAMSLMHHRNGVSEQSSLHTACQCAGQSKKAQLVLLRMRHTQRHHPAGCQRMASTRYGPFQRVRRCAYSLCIASTRAAMSEPAKSRVGQHHGGKTAVTRSRYSSGASSSPCHLSEA